MADTNITAKRIITLKFRVKDKHRVELSQQARAVNFVFNYCNELSSRAITDRGAAYS